MRPIGDTLAARVAERRSQIVLGLDPDPAALWPDAGAGGGDGVAAADAVRAHCLELVDAAAPACVGVKLQLARFELLGADGWALMKEIAAHARREGLLVIADGKRGDIGVSAAAYADALLAGRDSPLGRLEGLGADLVTVNPLMGSDAIEPFILAARAAGAGVLVLVRTSNPGAAELQDLALANGGALWEALARMVDELGEGAVDGGIADVGAVLGATEPRHLARARELMPSAVFLLPGVGAQGGRIEDLSAAFRPGRGGGLITASRSIADAYRAAGGEPAAAARAEAERLREVAWTLSGEVLRAHGGAAGVR